MGKNKSKTSATLIDRFPISTILARWLFTGAELGMAFYFMFNYKFNFGLIFVIYAIVCGFVILPLIRCTKCYYYGKLCNFGWGVWVSKMFPRSDDTVYSSAYGISFLFWPLRVFPVGLSLIPIAGAVKIWISSLGEGLSFASSLFVKSIDYFGLILLGCYLLIIYFHRKFYRAKACSRCHQQTVCPVYDKSIIPGKPADTQIS